MEESIKRICIGSCWGLLNGNIIPSFGSGPENPISNSGNLINITINNQLLNEEQRLLLSQKIAKEIKHQMEGGKK